MFCRTLSQGKSLASWKISIRTHLGDGPLTGSPSRMPELMDSRGGDPSFNSALPAATGSTIPFLTFDPGQIHTGQDLDFTWI